LTPEPPQGYRPSTFWRPRGTSKIDRFSDPSKSTKVGDKVAPWPPIGRQGFHLAYFWGPFWYPFFIIFYILFRTPQNHDFAIPYVTFEGFKHPKSSHFSTPLQSLFRPHFGTPFGRAFWPFLAPQGADPASPCRFWVISWTPLGVQNAALERPGRPEKPKQASRKLCGRGPVCVLEAPCAPKGSREPFSSILNPLGHQGAFLGPPLADIRLVLGPRGWHKALCSKDFAP